MLGPVGVAVRFLATRIVCGSRVVFGLGLGKGLSSRVLNSVWWLGQIGFLPIRSLA